MSEVGDIHPGTTPDNNLEAAILDADAKKNDAKNSKAVGIAIQEHTIQIGDRAIKVATPVENNVTPETIDQAAAGLIAKEIILGVDPESYKVDEEKFYSLDDEGKAMVAVELIRALGLQEFKHFFENYFRTSADKLVVKLIQGNLGETVARHLREFAKTQDEREKIAILLIWANQGFRVAVNKKNFGELKPETVEFLNMLM